MSYPDPAPTLDAVASARLAESLVGLAAIVCGDSVEELLTDVSSLAILAVPGADGAGATMLESGQPDTIVGSAAFVTEVDTVQYRLGEGPCISAAATARTTGSSALGEDTSWPTFGPLAAALDIHSALSLPLVLDGEVLGALNVYAHARGAFDRSSRHAGQLFARPAAVTVHNARVLCRARRAAEHAETALTSRSTIDQAIGIIMSRAGIAADEAFLRLRILSQHEQVKLRVVAAKLVDEAVRKARARRSPAEALS
jgi:GAF domain-containing protein